MDCPNCEVELEKRRVHGVEVEECPKCQGLWFAPGEFRQAKDEAEPDLRWADFDVWLDQDSLNVAWSERDCPVCGRKLATIAYQSTGETIEYCTHYHGIWLDKGEFENIIAALEQQMDAMSASDYLRQAVGEAREIITGPKGFISEWKDLGAVLHLLQLRILADNPVLADAVEGLQSSHPLG